MVFGPLRSPVDAFDDDDDIDDWMARRNVQLAAQQDAEAAGREAWNQATQTGQDVTAATPHDLIQLGAQKLRDDNAGGDAAQPADSSSSVGSIHPVEPDGPLTTPPNLRFETARPGDSISKLVGTSDPAAVGRFLSLNGMDPRSSTILAGQSYAVPTQFDDASDDEMAAGAGVLRADNARLAALRAQRAASSGDLRQTPLGAGQDLQPGFDAVAPTPMSAKLGGSSVDDLDARKNAALQGYFDGLLPGAFRGGANTLKGLAPLAHPIVGQVLGILQHSADIASGHIPGADFPTLPAAWQKTKDLIHHANVELNPLASPLASTREGAYRQGEHFGENHGEVWFDAAMLPVGGEVAEAAEGRALARTALDATGYEAKGTPPEIAKYFAQPYKGMGSHLIARDSRFPGFLGGGPLPSWFIDSRYNVWKPEGATRGQVFQGHVENDLRYNGGPLPGRRGKGSGWSGPKLGWEKNPPLDRFINRMPAVTKGTLGGAMLAGLNFGYDALDQDQPQ
ncbi:MAG: hypothetical protein E7812_04315 [Phenylobacterium sp.]|nr:MAG: hypothetical protein E7812_04315 [Phenylobacterium sp.]